MIIDKLNDEFTIFEITIFLKDKQIFKLWLISHLKNVFLRRFLEISTIKEATNLLLSVTFEKNVVTLSRSDEPTILEILQFSRNCSLLRCTAYLIFIVN